MQHIKCFKSVYLQGISWEFDCSSSVHHSLVQPLSFSQADPCSIPCFSPWYTPITGIKDRTLAAYVKNLVIKGPVIWTDSEIFQTYDIHSKVQGCVAFYLNQWRGIASDIHAMMTWR